jgi:hypothetical protein
MRRKPDLTIVEPDTNGTQPPCTLGKPGVTLWRTLTANYHFEDAGGIEMLAQLCGAVDRVEALSERIRADGEVIYVKGVPRANPCLKEELALRAFVCRTLQRLGLNLEVVKPVGRPGGSGYAHQ